MSWILYVGKFGRKLMLGDLNVYNILSRIDNDGSLENAWLSGMSTLFNLGATR